MGNLLGTSRLVFALGRDGYLPRAFAGVSVKHRVPLLALGVHAGLGWLMALLGNFDQLALISGFIAGLFTDRLYGESSYWMLALTFALHRIQVTDAAERSPAGAAQPAEVAAAPAAWHWSAAGARAK